jgi:hypothetical protein
MKTKDMPAIPSTIKDPSVATHSEVTGSVDSAWVRKFRNV